MNDDKIMYGKARLGKTAALRRVVDRLSLDPSRAASIERIFAESLRDLRMMIIDEQEVLLKHSSEEVP